MKPAFGDGYNVVFREQAPLLAVGASGLIAIHDLAPFLERQCADSLAMFKDGALFRQPALLCAPVRILNLPLPPLFKALPCGPLCTILRFVLRDNLGNDFSLRLANGAIDLDKV